MPLDDIGSLIVDSLHKSSFSVLMLDYDGTLAPFREERDRAYPYPGVRDMLHEIMQSHNTRLVVISGRAIVDLMPLLGLRVFPEIWGAHGWERRRTDGSYSIMPADKGRLQGLADAELLIEQNSLGEYCETKPRSIAFHWRGLTAEKREIIERFVETKMKPLAVRHDLKIKRFDGGMELRIPGMNKGDVVRSIMADLPGGCFCAYLGDDLTDEDAFEAISDQGLGILVHRETRPTKARGRLVPPGELIQFLKLWEANTRKERSESGGL